MTEKELKAVSHYKKGYQYYLSGDLEKSIKEYKNAIKLVPNFAECLINLGAAYQSSKSFQKAIKVYLKATKLLPSNTTAMFNLGICYQSAADYKNAITYLNKTHILAPKDIETILQLGDSYYMHKNYKLAAETFEKALLLKPKDLDIIFKLANAYIDLEDYKKGMRIYKNALKIKPKHAETLANLGLISRLMGNEVLSKKYYEKALEQKPTLSQAHNNLGILFESSGELELALESYKKGIENAPFHSSIECNYAYALMQACEWEDSEKIRKSLSEHTNTLLEKNIKPGETPFFNLVTKDDPKLNLIVSKSWSKTLNKTKTYKHNWPKNIKIKIGYASDGFRDFPTAQNLISVFENHDKSKFEIYHYSYGEDDKSIYRKRIEKASDSFKDIRDIDNKTAAKIIHEDKIDILIDLKGYTQGSRLEIFAYKPSPIQVSYLGFPGTTGANFIDYMIADKTVIPKNYEKYYSEKIVYLPNSYRATDDRPLVANFFHRKEMSLPEDAFVFASFNQTYKIEPYLFDVWMRILKKVPNSVLWQWSNVETTQMNLKLEAEKRGISPARIIFAPNARKKFHLSRIQCANLALDTYPTNGHTTTVDCLYVGVPVLTLMGKNFSSRVSASCLKAAKLDWLITKNLKEYESLAIKIAKTKKKTKIDASNTPLFDTLTYTENLEKLYKNIYDTHHKRN